MSSWRGRCCRSRASLTPGWAITQQAVEKSLKAVLALGSVEFPYTHDLGGLVRLCQTNDIDVPEGLSGVGDLSPFAARLRYGATLPAPLDRDQALKWAASAVEWARQRIESHEHPPADAGPDTGHPQ